MQENQELPSVVFYFCRRGYWCRGRIYRTLSGFLNRRWSTALMAAVTIQPFVHIIGSIGKWAFTEEVNHILTRQAIVNSASKGTPCHIPRDNLLLE
jgi:hypothetical protein